MLPWLHLQWSDSEGDGPSLDLNDSAIVADAPTEDLSAKEDAITSKDWLLENVSAPYWKEQYQTAGPPAQSPLAHPSCDLAEKW